jgi:beta-phosphoglucomutase-like phosphatase (HAD superfamily)
MITRDQLAHAKPDPDLFIAAAATVRDEGEQS